MNVTLGTTRHPLHPVLAQAAVGAWTSASIVDLAAGDEEAARLLTGAGLAAGAPAVLAGLADWSEQHEQQRRVGVVHALANATGSGLFVASLAARSPRRSRVLRLAGLAVVSVSASLGGYISFRLAGGANHAEPVPHLIRPGWHYLMVASDLPESRPVRQMIGEHVAAPVCQHPDRAAWIAPPTSRVSKLGWGAVAGPRATDPSAMRKVLPCHGQVRQAPELSADSSPPDSWPDLS